MQTEWLSVWNKRRERAERAKAEAKGDDAQMLDAVIGQQPLGIALKNDEAGGDEDRQRPENDQEAAGEMLAKRVLHRRDEAHDAVERGVQQKPGKHRRNRRRRLAVRVGQPRMDRREAGLGAVADENEDEGEFHQRRIEMRFGGGEVCPEQGVGLAALPDWIDAAAAASP